MFAQNYLSSYGVYRIVAPSGSCYIGMTTRSFASRWREHLNKLNRQDHHCKGLLYAFNKYGSENMSFEVLEDMNGSNIEDVLYKEDYWWLLHKPWVNLYNGRPSSNGAVIHTKETRERISNSVKESYKNRGYSLDSKFHTFCDMCGVKRITSNKPLTDFCKDCLKVVFENEYKKIIEDYYLVDKLSAREIGRKLSIDHKKIRRFLREWGINIVPRTFNNHTHKPRV